MNPLSLILNTLSSGVVYTLFAFSIVLAYRTSRILLFCIGEIGMTSAYVLLQVWNASVAYGLGAGSGFALGLLAALLVSALLGAVLYLVLGRLGTGGDSFVGTVVTIAFSIVLLGVMTTLWRGDIARLPVPEQSLTVLGQSLPLLGVGITVIGALLIAALLTVFYRSGVGVEMQALASNRALAELRGIAVQRRLATVWITAALISGVAGIFSAALSAVSIEGATVGFSGIVAAIIGGLTSPAGAIAGALLLAAGENVTSLYFDARYSVAVPVVLLVILLAVRPSGLSARVEHIART